MIPLFAVVRIVKSPGRAPRIWVPLFLIWLLLAPLALLLLPIAVAACLIARINPTRALSALFGCLAALRGTHIEVDTRQRSVLIHVY